MCIYLGDSSDLHYEQQEHIFSSFLGGQKMLERGMVSDEANHILSQLEDELAHKSVLQLPRAFMGPGKRSTNKLNSVVVYPLKNEKRNSWELGYVFLGESHLIPHIRVLGNEFVFSCDDGDEESVKGEANKFFQRLNKFKTARYTEIRLPIENQNFFLLGFFKNKWYLYRGNIDISEIYKKVAAISETSELKSVQKGIFQPQVHGIVQETEKTDRAYAKIAFNILANLYGENYVMHANFDELRSWIINGGNNTFTITISDKEVNEITKDLNLPLDSHWCILTLVGSKICAIISLYDKTFRAFEFCEKPSNAQFHINGMICDWKNKKEYTLTEWIDLSVRSKREDLLGEKTNS